jgi:alpha-ribazole phosphatase
MQLATALARRDDCTVLESDELRELNFGDWEGRCWSEIPRAISDVWAADCWQRAPPNGEAEAALWERVDAWRRRHIVGGMQRVAVVAHGGSLRALRCQLLQLAPQHRWEWQIAYGESLAIKPAAIRS